MQMYRCGIKQFKMSFTDICVCISHFSFPGVIPWRPEEEIPAPKYSASKKPTRKVPRGMYVYNLSCIIVLLNKCSEA